MLKESQGFETRLGGKTHSFGLKQLLLKLEKGGLLKRKKQTHQGRQCKGTQMHLATKAKL